MTHPFTLVDCGLSSGTNKIYKSYIITDIKMTQYCVCPFTMSNAMWPQATSNCAKKKLFFWYGYLFNNFRLYSDAKLHWIEFYFENTGSFHFWRLEYMLNTSLDMFL